MAEPRGPGNPATAPPFQTQLAPPCPGQPAGSSACHRWACPQSRLETRARPHLRAGRPPGRLFRLCWAGKCGSQDAGQDQRVPGPWSPWHTSPVMGGPWPEVASHRILCCSVRCWESLVSTLGGGPVDGKASSHLDTHRCGKVPRGGRSDLTHSPPRQDAGWWGGWTAACPGLSLGQCRRWSHTQQWQKLEQTRWEDPKVAGTPASPARCSTRVLSVPALGGAERGRYPRRAHPVLAVSAPTPPRGRLRQRRL